MKKDRQPSGAISFFSNFEAKLKIVGLGGTAFLLMTLFIICGPLDGCFTR
ncbi:hypothetical protein [Fructobacillus tropaeoli]|uniref:Uncharacterized protein n=1 Tax=Fructobacillus tropaeoli TaxID=709323 RepID=A0ABN9YJN5_9LACO|nr:hypothetical protein [Fructobacillus tropaeoli]GIC69993.1 hypothetical protein FT12353_06320 [Fructobacillus tropaeoli]CAK1225994.1 unnamed protein product [Fructobacillus tropaeoli]CAK1227449.1 unnamed protein product [Fructobacillus tropaeoli]